MKFLHIADLHIGKVVAGFQMLEDQKIVLNQIIDLIKQEKPDGILIAGDIYDRSVPSAEAIAVFDAFLTKVYSYGCSIFMVSGNHDSPERLGFAGEILKQHKLYIAGEVKEEIEKVSLFCGTTKLNIYLLPFARVPVLNSVFQMDGKDYNDCIKVAIEKMKLNPEEINLLVTHYFVSNGTKKPELSESEVALSVGSIEEIDSKLLEVFDYVALGHIHGPQWVGKETIRYAGSLLKYSFSEALHHKSVTVIDIIEKGNIIISTKELILPHNMRKIKGKLEELIKEETVKSGNPMDYLHVTLTNKEELINPIGVLKSVYPNIMQLVFEKNIAEQQEKIEINSIQGQSTLEIYRTFFEEVTSYEIDIERYQIMKKVLEQLEEMEQ